MEGVFAILLLVLFVVGVAVVRGLIRNAVLSGVDAVRKHIDKNAGKYEASDSENLSDRFKR